MSKCPNCGTESAGAFCPKCGAAVPQTAPAPAPAPNPTINVIQQTRPEITEKDLPDKYKPLSPWAYFGYSILLSLPIVGIILLFVYTFSTKNINRRNWVRSFWCWLLICVILWVIALVIAFATGSMDKLMAYFSNLFH